MEMLGGWHAQRGMEALHPLPTYLALWMFIYILYHILL